MAWWMAVPVAISAAGTIASLLGGNKAANAIRERSREEARRFRLQADQVLGEARASAAASGTEFGSESLQKYLGDMALEFKRQEDWIRKHGRQEASAMQTSSLFSSLSGLGSSFFSLASSNNYWRK